MCVGGGVGGELCSESEWVLLVFIVPFPFQVYDGPDNTADLIGAFSSSSMLGVTLSSTSNHLWLEFFSDQDDTAEGFKLNYSSKDSS